MHQEIQDIEAVHPGEGHVGEHQVEALFLKTLQTGLSVRSSLQIIAFGLQNLFQGLSLSPIIFHHEDAGVPLHD